jgi:hypothetical protein
LGPDSADGPIGAEGSGIGTAAREVQTRGLGALGYSSEAVAMLAGQSPQRRSKLV